MLAAYTERCTSSLSYLLVQLIFSVPSEAASQDVPPDTVTKIPGPTLEELSQAIKDAHFVTSPPLKYWLNFIQYGFFLVLPYVNHKAAAGYETEYTWKLFLQGS
uniref:Uncharacterized protein n=1 Tax=Monopterus albus TaxID=43700 RepID=A0A3Q3ILP5_MONAL